MDPVDVSLTLLCCRAVEACHREYSKISAGGNGGENADIWQLSLLFRSLEKAAKNGTRFRDGGKSTKIKGENRALQPHISFSPSLSASFSTRGKLYTTFAALFARSKPGEDPHNITVSVGIFASEKVRILPVC